MVSTATKDPRLVEAGRRGAARRWGDVGRVVRLSELDSPVRLAVEALIRADRAARNEKASPVIETIEAGREARRASVDPQRAA